MLKALRRDVIRPPAEKFPTPAGEVGFADGCVHSFSAEPGRVRAALVDNAVVRAIGDAVTHPLRLGQDRRAA